MITILLFQGIITANFEELGIDDKQTGYIGVGMSISCAIVSSLISFLVAKKLKNRLKVSLLLVPLHHSNMGALKYNVCTKGVNK